MAREWLHTIYVGARLFNASLDCFPRREARAALLVQQQAYGADSAFDGELDCCGGFADDVVDVIVAVAGESVRTDGADPAGGVDSHTDVFGQSNHRLAYAAMNVHMQIGFSRAGEVEVQLSDAGLHLEIFHAETLQAQITGARADLYVHVYRNVIREAQLPIIAPEG